MHNLKPLVSVIITTYKRPIFLGRAISSVLSQTYETIELIVVDDNDDSTEYREATKELMSFYRDDGRVEYVMHLGNKGLSAARNTGIAHARGQLLAFLDDDDEWLSEKLEKQVAQYLDSDDPDLAVVYCGWTIVRTDGTPVSIETPNLKGNVSDQVCLNVIGPPSMVLCSKDAALKVGGFDEKLKTRSDIDFYLRVSRDFTFDYVSESLMIYYISEDAMSRNTHQKIDSYEFFLKKHIDFIRASRRRHKEYLERLGDLYIENNDKRNAIQRYFDAIRLVPRDPVVMMKMLSSVFGYQSYLGFRYVFRKLKELKSWLGRASTIRG